MVVSIDVEGVRHDEAASPVCKANKLLSFPCFICSLNREEIWTLEHHGYDCVFPRFLCFGLANLLDYCTGL